MLLAALPLSGQELSNLKMKEINISADTVRLDSLSISPGSLVLVNFSGDTIRANGYSFDPVTATLLINRSVVADTVLKATYRVLPIDLDKKYFEKDIRNIKGQQPGFEDPFVFRSQPANDLDEVFRMDGLSKSGSISRGISFGSSQDVVVNSNFNLQLSGRLGPEVEVLAAITDNNVPIQPYGNSQLIQEFDKVFIQLKYRRAKLIAGDFELKRPSGYFMNFFKRLQGGAFSADVSMAEKKFPGKDYNYRVKLAAALSKGKFARNRIRGVEGNQGPYKLTGADGETFIIVLAGTERVYIDGRLMQRGENFDYVIDYNTAEITFTPNVLITKDKRIVVEFEYSDRRYARSLIFAGNEFTLNKTKVRLNFYSEQDLKNQSLEQDLSDEDKSFLSVLGDNIDDAFRPGYDSIGFEQGEIRYKITDTVINSQVYDSVFIYSTDPDSAVYRVSFSRVGQGQGNYVLKNTGVNGRIYEWIAPINGIPQGNFEPVRLLITPKKTQMFVAGGEHRFSDRTTVTAELAVSDKDLNTFSQQGDSDDTGLGAKVGIIHAIPLGGKDGSEWSFRGKLDYEFAGSRFEPVERYRSVEFERDWNLGEQTFESNQHLGALGLELSREKLGKLEYEFNSFMSGEDYKGFRNRAATSVEFKSFNLDFDGSILNTEQETRSTRFIRQKGSFSKDFKKITIGIREELEDNEFREKTTDTLTSESFSFFEWEVFLETPDTAKTPFRLSYKQRTDKLPYGNKLERSSVGREAAFSLRLLNRSGHRLTLSSTYRSLAVIDTALVNQPPEDNLLGRLEHFVRFLKGAVTFNTFYELGSGLDKKQEFYYLKVPDGEGIYTWIDYNGDGIEQLNEFEVAPFKDQANYIRAFVQSNEFVRGYYNKFTESVNFQPAAVWKGKKGIRKFLARFSNQFVFRTESRSRSQEPGLAYNPLAGITRWEDTSLVSVSSSFRNTLYFDRMSTKFSADLNFLNNNNKTLLVNGFEYRSVMSNGINLRWNFYKAFTFNFSYNNGKSERRSEFFGNNNYSLKIDDLRPGITWQPSTSFRIEANYEFSSKRNTFGEGEEKALMHKGGVESSYRIVNRGNLQVSANIIRINYNGEPNTPLAFEMLEGFQPGNNATWSVSYQQSLSKFLQLNLVYDGRRSEGSKIVHVGSIQVRAHF